MGISNLVTTQKETNYNFTITNTEHKSKPMKVNLIKTIDDFEVYIDENFKIEDPITKILRVKPQQFNELNDLIYNEAKWWSRPTFTDVAIIYEHNKGNLIIVKDESKN